MILTLYFVIIEFIEDFLKKPLKNIVEKTTKKKITQIMD